MATSKRTSSLLVGTYALIATVGLVVVAYSIIRLTLSTDPTDDLPFLEAAFANWTTTLLILDLLIAAIAAIIWAVSEARRLGMKWVLWLVLLSTTPIAFTLPLFLAMRERKRDALAYSAPTG